MSESSKVCRRRIMKNRRAASPAVSMVIITAATVVLVLVSGSYALQVLQSQQAASEFNTVQKSILAFDDAVRDIAWDRGGSRSVRFNTNYGYMRLISSNKSFEISTSGFDYNYNFTTAVVKYYMPLSYFTLGHGYSSYILGDNRTVVSSLTDSFGQALVKQETGFTSIALNYRVRVSREGPSTIVDSTPTSYVDILVIRLNCTNLSIASNDFDLVAKNVGLTTNSSSPYSVSTPGWHNILVSSDGIQNSIPIYLDSGQVVFNLIIADVRVST